MRTVVIIICIALLGLSCSKDTTDIAYPGGPRLSRILAGGIVSSEFSYDTEGRLVKKISYLSSGVIGSESTGYYDSGRLVKVENAFNISSSMTSVNMDRGYAALYYDNNNRLKETRNYRLVGNSYQYVSRSVPEYDARGRTISVTLYDPNNGTLYNKNTYQYNAADNVIVEEFYQANAGLPGPSTRREYEYDGFKNPYKGHWVMPFTVNANNITKITGTNYLSSPGITAPATATTLISIKTYNSDGYPVLVNEYGVDYVYEYR
jgi:hypothetical protein